MSAFRSSIIRMLRVAIVVATMSTSLFSQEAFAQRGPSFAYTIADAHAAMDGASPLLHCLVKLESGYDPNAINPWSGALGMAQLLSPGELDHFYANGFTDPTNPWQARAHMEIAIAEGRLTAWVVWPSCV